MESVSQQPCLIRLLIVEKGWKLLNDCFFSIIKKEMKSVSSYPYLSAGSIWKRMNVWLKLSSISAWKWRGQTVAPYHPVFSNGRGGKLLPIFSAWWIRKLLIASLTFLTCFLEENEDDVGTLTNLPCFYEYEVGTSSNSIVTSITIVTVRVYGEEEEGTIDTPPL